MGWRMVFKPLGLPPPEMNPFQQDSCSYTPTPICLGCGRGKEGESRPDHLHHHLKGKSWPLRRVGGCLEAKGEREVWDRAGALARICSTPDRFLASSMLWIPHSWTHGCQGVGNVPEAPGTSTSRPCSGGWKGLLTFKEGWPTTCDDMQC